MRHTQCSVTKKKEEEKQREGKPIMKFSNYLKKKSVCVCCFRPLGKYLTSRVKSRDKEQATSFSKIDSQKTKNLLCVCVAPMCVCVCALSLSIFSHFRDFSLRECRFDDGRVFVIWNIVLGHYKDFHSHVPESQSPARLSFFLQIFFCASKKSE